MRQPCPSLPSNLDTSTAREEPLRSFVQPKAAHGPGNEASIKVRLCAFFPDLLQWLGGGTVSSPGQTTHGDHIHVTGNEWPTGGCYA